MKAGRQWRKGISSYIVADKKLPYKEKASKARLTNTGVHSCIWDAMKVYEEKAFAVESDSPSRDACSLLRKKSRQLTYTELCK